MPKYQFRFWTPLVNFQSGRQSIKLNNKLRIAKASSSEKEILSDLQKKWTNINISDYLLELIIEKNEPEKEEDGYLKDARNEIEKAITILRLFREEPIGFNLIIQAYSDNTYNAYSANFLPHYRLWATITSTLSRQIYKLNETEVKKLRSFYKKYDLYDIFKFGLAIAYFNKSYIEPYTPRDSFLDIMICLENLFLKNTYQELRYKLSMRIAHVLGRDVKERNQLFKFLMEAYKLRSIIVHGGDTNKLNEECLFHARGIARKSILYFLNHNSLWSSKKLDGIILNGKYYPKHSL